MKSGDIILISVWVGLMLIVGIFPQPSRKPWQMMRQTQPGIRRLRDLREPTLGLPVRIRHDFQVSTISGTLVAFTPITVSERQEALPVAHEAGNKPELDFGIHLNESRFV